MSARLSLTPLFALFLMSLASAADPPQFAEGRQAFAAKDYAKALQLFTAAAEQMPTSPGVFANRGNCHSMLDNLPAALADYDRAFAVAKKEFSSEKDPRLAYLHYCRGTAYDRAGKMAEAIAEYEKGVAINPKEPELRNTLAWVLATCSDEKLRQPLRAFELAKSECEFTAWKDPVSIDTFAAAYAASKDFMAAVRWQQIAIELCKDEEIKKELSARLALYRGKTPYVEQR